MTFAKEKCVVIIFVERGGTARFSLGGGGVPLGTSSRIACCAPRVPRDAGMGR